MTLSVSKIFPKAPLLGILSCFSILELLLTTFRSRNSTDSSLSHQLKKKLTLLNNQVENKVEVSKYFNGPDTLTLEIMIEKLYQYRNDVAHGNLSDFENDLQILKNQRDSVLPFLNTVIKNTLVFALRNPQIVTDLKEC